MASEGLLTGLAAFGKGFNESYDKERDYQLKKRQSAEEKAMRDRMAAMQQGEKELVESEPGKFEFSPEKKERLFRDEEVKRQLLGLKMEQGQAQTGLIKAQTKKAGNLAIQPKQSQIISGGYAARMENAENTLKSIGFDPTSQSTGLLGWVPEMAKSGGRKQYEQIKRDFITAVLRQESGAAISPQEYTSEEAKYFPQSGDTPEVVAQKEKSRQIAIQTMKQAAGPAMSQRQGLVNQSVPRGTVQVRDKTGQIYEIDPSDLEEALEEGAEKVE